MIVELIFAIIQAFTEFLPISSSGHLALVSNFISFPNLFLFTFLHLASLIAVLIFLRREIYELVFSPVKNRKIWLYWIIATIPAALFGYLLSDLIDMAFSSFFYLGIFFIFTGIVIFLTKFTHFYSKLNLKNSLLIGLAQIIALFPGISRSGITISSGLFLGLEREKAAKFSFLLFIPLSIGAFGLELLSIKDSLILFDISYILPFLTCVILSLFSLQVLKIILRKEYFWMFSFYCLLLGIICLIIAL